MKLINGPRVVSLAKMASHGPCAGWLRALCVHSPFALVLWPRSFHGFKEDGGWYFCKPGP